MILWGRDLCLLFLDAANTVELDLAALYLRRMGYCLWVLGDLECVPHEHPRPGQCPQGHDERGP